MSRTTDSRHNRRAAYHGWRCCSALCPLLLGACLALAACAGTGEIRPQGARSGPMDDATITVRVKAVLLNDPQVAAGGIDVATSAGVVTISGTVRSAGDEARAIELARGVAGVLDVKSSLRIAP
ncbi:MAG: BON domain-containing protein [Acidobacteria bacterium]|nr:BON domain-containing protein [Acidobacteriota bacterium]